MKVKDIFEAFIPRDGAIDERDADHEVRIVVHAPGSLGGTPSVGLSARGIQVGFDWDNGKLLLNPEFPLTRLTPEDVAAIHESVKKGQSWHAYQAHKKTKEKHSEQLQQCKEEIARLRAENERWRQNYEHLIEQHMPRTGHGCEEGWSRVVEARELQAQVDQLKSQAGLQVLLAELDEALEDLEMHGRHSDQGYRKLKDWYRKVSIACRDIDQATTKEQQV